MPENNHLPGNFKKFDGAEKLPLMTVLWVSNVCNARCGHCPFNLDKSLRKLEKNSYMQWETFKKIVDDLSVEKDRLIRLTGVGEPLLNKNLMKFVTYAKKKGLKVGLITNGSLLDSEKINTLLTVQTDIIEISIDAMDKETYSTIRVGLDFDQVRGNILRLIERRNTLKSSTKVIVSIINQPDKLKDPEKAVQYWEKIVDKVLLRKWITWNVLDQKNFTEPFLDTQQRVPCPWPFDRMHITADGDVVFCADDLKREHIIGNVMQSSVGILWDNEKFKHYRQCHLDRRFDKINICEKCVDWPYKSWKFNYHKTVGEFDGEK